MKLLLALAIGVAAMPAAAKVLHVKPGGDAREAIQTALLDAKPGDTVRLAAGRYPLAGGLSLDVAGVTVEGAGPDKTILDFTSQKGEGEGLLVTSSGVVMRNFAVENAAGNGIKSKGSDGISFVDLRVEWTGGPKSTNGAYGVYPVSSKNVLIERVTVRGASDAGIYVGQSSNIIVRHNRAEYNVAGIEIENSYHADVHDNVATKNAGGILVFDLPDLPQMGGHSVRVFDNKVVDNDTPNFAAPGNIVASVPTGTGIMVMANRNVHLVGNEIDGNGSAAIMLIAYSQKFTDKSYNPLPRDVAVRGNRFGRNGFAPAFPAGKELAAAVGGTIPPVMTDGVTRYTVPGGAVVERQGTLAINQGPLLDLRLGMQGTPPTAARPSVTDMFMMATLEEPPAVVLPAEQLARAGVGAKVAAR